MNINFIVISSEKKSAINTKMVTLTILMQGSNTSKSQKYTVFTYEKSELWKPDCIWDLSIIFKKIMGLGSQYSPWSLSLGGGISLSSSSFISINPSGSSP